MSNVKEKNRQSVIVNIYDMVKTFFIISSVKYLKISTYQLSKYSMNNYTAAIGVGIYHCGIEVYGVG